MYYKNPNTCHPVPERPLQPEAGEGNCPPHWWKDALRYDERAHLTELHCITLEFRLPANMSKMAPTRQQEPLLISSFLIRLELGWGLCSTRQPLEHRSYSWKSLPLDTQCQSLRSYSPLIRRRRTCPKYCPPPVCEGEGSCRVRLRMHKPVSWERHGQVSHKLPLHALLPR